MYIRVILIILWKVDDLAYFIIICESVIAHVELHRHESDIGVEGR